MRPPEPVRKLGQSIQPILNRCLLDNQLPSRIRALPTHPSSFHPVRGGNGESSPQNPQYQSPLANPLRAAGFGRVHDAGFAKAHRPPQHRGPCELHFAGLQDDRLVKRLMLPTITFANKYSQQRCVMGQVHKCLNSLTSASLVI